MCSAIFEGLEKTLKNHRKLHLTALNRHSTAWNWRHFGRHSQKRKRQKHPAGLTELIRLVQEKRVKPGLLGDGGEEYHEAAKEVRDMFGNIVKLKMTHDEIRVLVFALNELRNSLIAEGRYTDVVDELLLKLLG